MKSNIKRILILLILGINFFLIINSNFHFSDNQKTRLNDPVKSEGYSVSFIHIDGNIPGNWTATLAESWCNLVNGIYVIENVTIDSSSSPTGSGIFINNSKTNYYIIRNCTLYNSGLGTYDAGIKLENTNNGTIINNNCSNNRRIGIYLMSSDNNTISGNIANSNSDDGIYLYGNNNTISGNTANNNSNFGIIIYGNNNTILRNTADNSSAGIFIYGNNNTVLENTINTTDNRYGIYLYDSSNITVSGNNITQCGVFIHGSSLEEFSSHSIDTTNLVNGKPVYYYTNETNLGIYNFTYVGDPGQVILVNCNNSNISNFNLSYASMGILLYYCNNNTISGNTANNNYDGIRISGNNNTISGNSANNNNDEGIIISGNNNTISGNSANNNKYFGIRISGSNATISGNTANNTSDDGIKISGNNNTISGNSANNNNDDGIIISGNNNTISGNSANNNNGEGISLYGSNNNILGNSANNNNIIGLHLSYGNNNNISGNNLTQCGVFIHGSSLEEFSSHSIDTTNLVNKKPVYYYTNETSLGTYNFTYAGDPGQVILVNCNNSKVSNFNLSYASMGILLYYSNNNTILGNIVNNNVDGMHLRYCNNNNISGNTVSNNSYIGIYLNGNNNTISGNSANNNKYFGIKIYGINNTISGNIVNNNSDDGIYLDGINSTILGNIVNNNNNGIYLSWYSYYNEITGNIINNNNYGIYLDGNNNEISGNTANNNKQVGIYLGWYSDYNNITKNILYNNTLGLLIDLYCWNNSIYENFFLQNGKHAVDEGSNNNWNSTTIGNYWDNHTGPDINNDGIVDNPYTYIGGSTGSIDYLPIAEDGAPQISINSPSQGDIFSSIAPNFDVIITGDYLDTMWFTLDGGSNNYTFTENGMINQIAWDEIDDGTITLMFYASDIPRNIGSAGVDIIKDTVAPVIIINSPAEGDRFGKNAPLFNITVDDNNLDIMWYSFDNGLTIYTITNNTILNQTAWAALAQGDVTITFYARDLAGNQASESVTVIKSVPSGLDPGVILTIVIVSIVGGVAVASIAYIMIKKRKASV